MKTRKRAQTPADETEGDERGTERGSKRETERERRETGQRGYPFRLGSTRHKSGIPGTQYIARGCGGGYKLQSQAWYGMHSHLLHYVIKLNGPGPNTALGYSHFYSSSPLIPLSSSPAAAGAGVPGHLLSTHRVGSSRRQKLLYPSHFGLRNEHRLYTDDRRNCPAVLENLALRWKRGCGRSRRGRDASRGADGELFELLEDGLQR